MTQSSPPPSSPNATSPNPSSGGKKIIIIVLCVVGGFLLLCCGGITTCTILAKRAATSVQDSALTHWETLQKEAEAQAKIAQAEAEKAAAEAAKNTNNTPTENPGNNTPTPPVADAGDFPADIKLYSPAKTTGETSTPKSTINIATSPSSIQTVYDFYNSQFTRNGWTRTLTGNYGAARTATYVKGKRTVSLSLSSVGNETMIQISHTTD